MENNVSYKRIPFDLELAKAITKGEKEGRIVCGNNLPARIICTDRLGYDRPIVVLIKEGRNEVVQSYTKNGHYPTKESDPNLDLFLEVPDEQEFKEGDIVICCYGVIGIVEHIDTSSGNMFFHCCYRPSTKRISFFNEAMSPAVCHLATSEEKLILIDALKKDGSDKAREYLKRFFNITLPYKFVPKEWVLAKNDSPYSEMVYSIVKINI